ncbi:MAG: DUF4340 domain-containing protein [Clostridia bacterium]|nr:DUF4340 domain-containing protein [Clostridia bacterium]
MKKQKILAIVMASLFVAMIGVYFALIRPLTSTADDNTVDLELLDGEIRITDKLSNFYIYRPIERSMMQSIKVENVHGGFTVYRDAKDKFQLQGFIGVNFQQELLSSLVVATGTPIAMKRVATDLDEAGLAEYGLDDPQAKWTITTITGEQHTMLVGDQLLTDGGYYVKYEPRNAVYIVGTSLQDTVLQHGGSLLQGFLTYGISNNDYYLMDKFTIWKDSEPVVRIDKVPASEMEDYASMVEVKLVYPISEKLKYHVNQSVYFNAIYDLVNLKGEYVVALNPSESQLESYGLKEPKYALSFEYHDEEHGIFVSAPQEDGYCYAISGLYGYQLVISLKPDALPWLDYTPFKWIAPSPFDKNITDMAQIKIEGKDVNVDFRFSFGKDSDDNITLDITDTVSGTVIKDKESENFKMLYRSLLNITNQEYAPLSDEDREALTQRDDLLIMTMTTKTRSGEITEFRFYKYVELSTGHVSTGKIFVTVNGIGEFYTSNDLVNKVLSDIPRVLAGLDIDSYIQYN